MPVAQSVYLTSYAKAYAGMIANGETRNIRSMIAEDAAGLAWGMPAWRGAGDKGVILAPTVNTLVGMVVATTEPQLKSDGTYALDLYPQTANVPILTMGVIWVVTGANCTDGAQAYATAVTGVVTPTVGSNIIMPGWFFRDTASSGALVRIARD